MATLLMATGATLAAAKNPATTAQEERREAKTRVQLSHVVIRLALATRAATTETLPQMMGAVLNVPSKAGITAPAVAPQQPTRV